MTLYIITLNVNQAELSRMQYSEERNTELKNKARNLQSVIRSKRDAVDNLSARLQRCDFHYTDPEKNFDRLVYSNVSSATI